LISVQFKSCLSGLYRTKEISLIKQQQHNDNNNNNNNNNLEKQDHGLSESLEVVYIIKTTFALHMHEEGHAKYGKDEHHKKQQETNVEQCWQ